MVRKWLSYLMVSLIVLQSMTAIADTFQLDHDKTDKYAMSHQHEHNDHAVDMSSEVNDISDADQASINQNDCHHHFHVHFFLQNNLEKLSVTPAGIESADYWVTRHTYLISPDIRPPIV